MSEENDAALLAALDRLVARYGPHGATRLAELIRDPERAEELAVALESAAARTRQRQAKPRPQRTDRVGMAVLNDLRMSDPQKHAVVAEIRRHLLSGTTLQSMNELRRFARIHDLSIGKASSRNAAIAPFLKSLSELATPEIVSLRDSMLQSAVDDRSLEMWRSVIVRPRLSKSDAEEETQ